MAERIAALMGAKRSLRVPIFLVGALGGTLATYYAVLTLPLAADGARLLLVLAGIATVTATLVALFQVKGMVATLDRVALGRMAPEPDNLKRAVREVLATPDRLFWLVMECWVGAGLFVAVGMWLFGPALPWVVPVRLVLMGLLFGPLSAVGAYFTLSLRARSIARRVCDLGLAPQDVIAAYPPSRTQLRGRLVAFTAILVLIPAAVTADLSSTFARRVMDEVVRHKDRGEQREVATRIRSQAIGNVAALGLVLLVVAVGTAYLGGTALGDPMREIAEEATRIAKGDLSGARAIPADDEVWAVSAAFTAMQANLSQVLTQLKRAGIQIGATTEQIVATSNRYEHGAAEQATALNETSATTEELARSARQIAENAGSVSEIAQKTLNAAQGGQESADAFSASMSRMRQDNQAIADAVVKLSSRVQQIGKIVEFINGVADKSDLLALSAELEGTKAGEVGRGFSLVAAEMRRLAENVIESTKEIEGLIEEIREATSAAVTATGAGVKATDSSGELAQQVSESLKEIVQLAGQTSDAVRSISLATQQQQTGTDQLAEAMADILRVTQQSLAATKQVTAANVDLSVLARDLKAAVERFQIGGG